MVIKTSKTFAGNYPNFKNNNKFNISNNLNVRNFPLHMVCMGAFAGGGKRSFDMENISRDYDQSAYKEKNLIERILSDIGSFKSNRDHKVKEFLKTKAFEYDSESSLINPSSDEYNDDLSLNQKVQFLRLLRKLSKKYQNDKNNINV